jgi:hypothetical protein
MALPKYATTVGIVILVVLFIALVISIGSNLSQGSTSTISWNDVKDKLGAGSFIYFWPNGRNVSRVTVDVENSYEIERITSDGEYNLLRGKYTISQIESPQDAVYRLVNSHTRNNYTQMSGTYYLTLDSKPAKYLLDTNDKSYELWQMDGQRLEGAFTGEADYEIYVMKPQDRFITYNATIVVTSGGNSSSYPVTAQTPHVHMVTGKSISAVFQKSGDDNAEMIVVLFDQIAHKVINRVTTDKLYGMVSLPS